MGKIRPFRLMYYFRRGYQLYFSFIFAGINTMVITYFLAIERAPFLKQLFPSFLEYAVVMISIGIPVLVLAGFIHFKKIPAFKSEQEVTVESNPYIYKLPPGFQKAVVMPQAMLINKILLRIAKSEKIISDDEIEQMLDLQKKIDILIQGGYVGTPPGKLPFDMTDNSSKK